MDDVTHHPHGPFALFAGQIVGTVLGEGGIKAGQRPQTAIFTPHIRVNGTDFGAEGLTWTSQNQRGFCHELNELARMGK
jgi:hypothetical protein